MSIPFQFFKTEWSKLYPVAAKAEILADLAPRSVCFYIRRALEIAVEWLYECDNSLTQPDKNDLRA
jgi:type I restriction enzyme, R subunit